MILVGIVCFVVGTLMGFFISALMVASKDGDE